MFICLLFINIKNSKYMKNYCTRLIQAKICRVIILIGHTAERHRQSRFIDLISRYGRLLWFLNCSFFGMYDNLGVC